MGICVVQKDFVAEWAWGSGFARFLQGTPPKLS